MQWIKQIFGFWFKDKLASRVEPPLILLQQEYYSLAWGLRHYGYYIASDGFKYSYNNPVKWNYYIKINKDLSEEKCLGNEKISFMEKKNLIQNLNFCEKTDTHKKIVTDQIMHLVDDLLNADLLKTMPGGNDMGLHSTALLVFDKSNNTYKRILLGCQGDFFLELNSNKNDLIFDFFS